MVRRCCILTCKNSRADCDEKVSFFKVPSDQGLFEKWAKVIGETGSAIFKTSAICERHFREEEIRREALLKDSDGNVIFQRPLTKFSLTKDAVPSIFNEDAEDPTLGKKKRKRRSVIPDYPEDLNLGNFTISNDGNLNINCSNILVAFNDNQNNLVHFNLLSNSTEASIMPIEDKSGEKNCANNVENINNILNTSYYFDGQEKTFFNGIHNANLAKSGQDKYENNIQVPDATKSIISIYIKPQQEIDRNTISAVANTNATFNSIDTSVINKEQLSQKIPDQLSNFNPINLDAPKEVTILVPEEEILILNESNNYAHNNSIQKNVQPKAGTIHYPLPESNIQMNIRAFDLIFHNSHKIKLPNPMWGYHKNSIDKDIIIFSKALWFKSDVLIPPIYEKQVIFHESDNVKIYINNKFSPLEVRRPKDVVEMEVILKKVDEIIVCSGGPNIGECDTAHCAQKDYAVSRWRHKLCPIILTPGETICKFCITINQVLRYPKKKRLAFGRRSAYNQRVRAVFYI